MNTLLNLAASTWLLLLPAVAHAYIGPGAGLGAIGTAIAVIFAILLLLVGFVWYPLKRFFRSRKARKEEREAEEA